MCVAGASGVSATAATSVDARLDASIVETTTVATSEAAMAGSFTPNVNLDTVEPFEGKK
jgi:hypothetical protein